MADSSTVDNTFTADLKKSFQSLLSSRRPSGTISALSFDDGNKTDHKITLSMNSIMEKEKASRLQSAELLHTKAELASLKMQHRANDVAQKRARIEFEERENDIVLQYQRELDKVKEERNYSSGVLTKLNAAETELKDSRVRSREVNTHLEAKLRDAEKQKQLLVIDLETLKSETSLHLTSLETQLRERDDALEHLRHELTHSTSHARDVVRQRDLALEQVEELRLCRQHAHESENKLSDLKLELAKYETEATLSKSTREQLAELPMLKSQNRKLSSEIAYLHETQENIVQLKEENLSKTKRLKEQDEKLVKQQAQLYELKHKLDSCSSEPSTSSPAKLANLQTGSVLLLEKQGVLQSSIKTLEYELELEREKASSVRSQLTEKTATLATAESTMRKLRKKLLFCSKEKEAYKGIIASYESEMTMNTTTVARGAALDQLTEQQEARMAQLEEENDLLGKQISQHKQRVALLEEKLRSSKEIPMPAVTSDADQKLIADLREKLSMQEQDISSLKSANEDLASRLEHCQLQGDYDPKTTKVLHLAANPADVAQERRARLVADLQEQNRKLKERVKILEEKGAVQDLTMTVEANVKQPNEQDLLQEANQMLKKEEAKNKHLVDVFRKTSKEFREAVYQMLGYKIDINANKYKLMSMYANSPDHFLMFQSDDGEIQMLANDYSLCLEDKIEQYLQGANSLPAFLAALTLELFQAQTLMQQSMIS